MDVDEVTDDLRQNPLWQFEVREREGYKHRMAKCVIGKNQHLRLSLTCYGPKWIQANGKGEANNINRCRDRSMAGHHLPTVVGVYGLRMLIWCRKCPWWATSNGPRKRPNTPCKSRDPRVAYQLKELKQGLRLSRISEEPYVKRRRVQAKQRKFERMCEVGTFTAQCITLHRIQEVRDEDGGIHDGVDEAVMLHKVDRRAHLHKKVRVW